MKAFVFGTIAGGLAVWRWREDIERYVRQGRERVVEVLDKSREQADAVIDRAKQTIEPGPRTATSAHGAGGSAPSQGDFGADTGATGPP